MANLQDLRRRVKSVRNMEQITKAMKLVAAAKLRRAQERVIAARPYAATMTRVLNRLAEQTTDYKHPLLERRGDKHYVVAVVTADKGLCGGFNTNLVKAAQQFLRKHADKQIDLVAVGRKGRDFFRRRPVSLVREYVGVTERRFDHSDTAQIARDLMDAYTAEESTVDRVYLIYNEFKSVMSQRITIKQLLPIGAEELGAGPEHEATTARPPDLVDYIWEQPPAEILARLLPRYVETQVFYALLESVAGEQGARMTAMDSASKNAGDVIENLTLTMNRARQASITREIIEVVSGAQALEG